MFRGSFVAMATPFSDDLSLDMDAYGRLVDFHLENGTHGLVPCGCTGEAATLSHDEQKQCVRFVVERVNGAIPVVAGTGSNNTKEAIDLTAYAKEVGADGALLITPYYNKPTPTGQIAHYNTVAHAVDIPIMMYNVPSRTGTKIAPETIAELSKTPNIVSIKEACGSVDQVTQIINQCDISVVSGDDALTLPMMAVGAHGVVSVAANVVPNRVAAQCEAFDEGNLDESRRIHYELVPLIEALFMETNPIPVKAILAKMGLIKNILRLPLTPMTSDSLNSLQSVLKSLGIC